MIPHIIGTIIFVLIEVCKENSSLPKKPLTKGFLSETLARIYTIRVRVLSGSRKRYILSLRFTEV